LFTMRMVKKELSILKRDIPASIVVFLVALPLCLGVALASGAPLLSGVISGIIGGIVVGFLSESQVSVSGPAAGLTSVVLASITQLGSFELFLVAVVLAGLFQLVAGMLKGGFIANYIPSNVIKGLLASIGIILILKQIPHAFGYDKDHEDDFTYLQSDGENTFSELLTGLNFFTPGAIVISVISLLVLIFWDKITPEKLKQIPSSLFVVILGIALNFLFGAFIPYLNIEQDHLVNIPSFESVSALITWPDFQGIVNPQVWFIAFTLMAIASLETLLNLEAVENIDPHRRMASPNRELVAQGVGNICSGLIGGIPITSVIVRSSVNINAGARTKRSAILHGVFLLVSVVLISSILNYIPLASLASILILTGYKLAKVKLFKDMYKSGWNHFIPFIITVISIVFTDLMIGVLVGLAVSIFFILKSNFQNPFVLQKETLHLDEILRIELPKQVSFLNRASIKETLNDLPANSRVIIDASFSDYIDKDVLEIIQIFKNKISKDKKIKVNLIGLKREYDMPDQIQFSNVLDKETQVKLTPDQVIEILKKGNDRFISGNNTKKYMKQQVNATSTEQHPIAVILSCIDSRTTAELVFDLGLGDIFSIRIAGNILNEDILGSMEFATSFVGAKLIVVLGHTKCSAITEACNDLKAGNLTTLINKIKPAINEEKTFTLNRNGSNPDFVNKVTELNVQLTLERIRNESPIISDLEKSGAIKIVGGIYNIKSGEVTFI